MCKCKELINKGVCDKRFIWSPSNCKCECDKLCDIGEYLDYSNCECRKKLLDKLIEECIKSIAGENKEENEWSSCTQYIVLFLIFFTLSIGIVTYFVYYKYISRNKENVSKYDHTYQAKNY